VTLVFEPQSGGSVPEREPGTNPLRQFVTAVLQRLGIVNPVNLTVRRKGESTPLNLDAMVNALGLHNGDKLDLGWQTSGGANE
jgi:hypothetical protein